MERKEAAWNDVLKVKDKIVKKNICMEIYRGKEKSWKGYKYQSKKDAYEQFRKKMNLKMSGNTK